MANAIVKLTSSTPDKRSVEITAGGPKQAQIVITASDTEIELMEDTQLREILSSKIIENSLLSAPVFNTPIDGVQNYVGDFILNEYQPVVPFVNPVISTVYQISTTKNFSYLIFNKTLTGTEVLPLKREDLINSKLVENTTYYIRARLCYDNYMTSYSDPISFTIGTSTFKKPIINSITLEENEIYTGNVNFNLAPEQIYNGSPGEPNTIEIQIANTKDNIYNKIELEKNLYIFSLHLIPFKLYPDNTYKIKFRYINTLTNIYSPFSDEYTLTIPKPRALPENFHINQDSLTIATNPTIGIDNIKVDYDFLDCLDMDFTNVIIPETEKSIIKNKFNNSYFKYTYKIINTGNVVYTKEIIRDYDSIVDNYYKGCLFSLNDYSLSLSTAYVLGLNFEWFDASNNKIDYITFTEESLSITTANFANTRPVDDIPNVIKTVNGFGYYGEITHETLIPDDIKYCGKLELNKVYKSNSEVVYNNELYLTTAETTITDFNNLTNLVKITKDNVKTYYKSCLPSGKWLIKELGIPTDLENISGVSNSKEGWIKVHNKANQIIYIAKKPFLTDIDYEYINERFLTGHGSRTIRIGLNLYNVRLLEYSPTRYIQQDFESTMSSTTNIEDELDLFKELFKSLGIYTPNDLGILDNNTVNYISNGVAVSLNNLGTDIKIDSIENSEDIIKNSNMKLYRPVLELIQEGYEPYRTHILNYDKWSDTGYFGKVYYSELLSSKEYVKILNLLDLNITNANPIYYKFYYHGMIVYIPTEPIGNNINYRILEETGIVNGLGTDYKIINGKMYRFILPSLTKNIQITHESYDVIEEYTGNSLVNDLLGRVITNLPNILLSNQDKWESSTMNNIERVIFRDKTIYKDSYKTLTIDNNQIVENELENMGYYLPIIITDALDFNKDLTYPTAAIREPTIKQQTVTVTKYKIEEKQIEKVREVLKTRIEKDYKTVTYIDKIPTGKINYNNVSKTEDNKFGLILFHCSKDETAYFSEELYKRKQLNISLSNQELKIGFSDTFPTLDSFIAKSVMITGKNTLIQEPLHINKFFNTATETKEYIRSIINYDLEFITLRNKAYNKVLTDENKKYPLGVLYGKISAEYLYYPASKFYNLSNPNYDTKINLNYSPTISIGSSTYKNSWTSILDRDGNSYNIPCLNSLIDYENYSSVGKDLIDNYIKYLNTQTDIAESIYKTDYAFGVVGADLETLSYLPSEGTITGDKYNPVLAIYPDTYDIPKYIGDGGKSNGKDFLDILNPIPEYTEVQRTETVAYDKVVEYTELETYTETIYERIPYEETVTIDVITYE